MEEHSGKLVSLTATVHVAALVVTGLGLRLGLAQATLPATGTQHLVYGLAAFAAAALFLWTLLRLVQLGEWAWYPAASLLLLLLYTAARYPARMSGWVAPLAAIFVGSAGVLLWRFAQAVRRADELQKRILHQAFAAGFVVELAAVLIASIANDAGAPRLHAIWWGVTLVAAWSAALTVSAARYE